MNGRIVQNDLDCADCACRICARSTYNDCSNPECEWAECVPCENCFAGESLLIETEDDCERFLPDFDDLDENERRKALNRAINLRPVVLCRDCRWWKKQKNSLQGRCELAGFYPTGEWFCANGEHPECGADMRWDHGNGNKT